MPVSHAEVAQTKPSPFLPLAMVELLCRNQLNLSSILSGGSTGSVACVKPTMPVLFRFSIMVVRPAVHRLI